MNRYETEHFSNRREYLEWLAEVYSVNQADVVLIASIIGTDRDFDGLPSALEELAPWMMPNRVFQHEKTLK